MDNSPKIVWQALPDTSQELAITSPADETLYCGTRGVGKTEIQLMFYRQYVGLGYGAYLRGVILDSEYKNLDDLVSRSRRLYTLFDDGARFMENRADYKWKWPTGEELLIRAADSVDDYNRFHGQEFPFLGWNELAKYKSKDLYEAMLSCNRTSFDPWVNTPHNVVSVGTPHAIRCPDGQYRCYLTPNKQPLPPIPLKVFSTTNPWGAGRGWVKKYFIDPAPYGKFIKETKKIVNPATRKVEDFTSTRVAIFGYFAENTKLPPSYISKLVSSSNKNQRKAWLEGDWNAAAGGAFEEEFDTDVHILPNFKIPREWETFRCFDWGSSKPFACVWFAIANGEEVIMPDGSIFCPPADSLIAYAEWYGCDPGPDKTNVGLRLGATAIAEGILKREGLHYEHRWLESKEPPMGGPADGQIYNTINKDDPTIAEYMKTAGVEWVRADKSKGSRINGLEIMRDMFRAAVRGEGRALYIMTRCRYSVALVPTVPIDPNNPDDVDSDSEDHLYDAYRYGALYQPVSYVQHIKVQYPS